MIDTTFIDELASAAPTPGGGGASAYVGALASALASMVGNLTVGKKTYAAVEDAVKAEMETLASLRARLIELIDADAAAFEPMAAAYRMPKDTPEQQQAKHDALQASLIGACEPPLAIMETCLEVVSCCEFMAENGSRLAKSDVGVACACARAAIDGASLNIYINAASMDDAAAAQKYVERTDALRAEAAARCDKLFADVLGMIRS